MLSANVFDFLKALQRHNNREWFNDNRRWYLTVKEEFDLLVTGLIMEVHSLDPQVQVFPARDYIFRIYRDTRFSPDKTPYKTNLGAYLSRNGKNGGYAGYYVHVEPGACMLAGGLYMPPAPVLKAVRREIYDNTEEFLDIINHRAFKKHFGEISGEMLKRHPAGYQPDYPHIHLLKFKSYTIYKDIPDTMVVSEIFLHEAREVFSAMVPFNRFLNQAIDNTGP